MSRGSTPRHAQAARRLGLAVQFNAAQLSLGEMVPRVTIQHSFPVRDLMPTHTSAVI